MFKTEFYCISLLGKCIICPLKRNPTPELVWIHYDREAVHFYFEEFIPFSFMFFFPLSEEKIKTNPKIVINMILPKKSYHCGILLLLYRDRIKESVSRI